MGQFWIEILGLNKKKYNSDAWILNFSFFADNSHKERVRMLISFVCVNVEN